MDKVWAGLVAGVLGLLAWIFSLMGKKQTLERQVEQGKVEHEIADAKDELVKVTGDAVVATDNYHKLRDKYRNSRPGEPIS